MRVPWWALPGVAALLFTLAIMSAAQGSLSATRVPLPHEVQLSNGATPTTTHPVPRPAPAPAPGAGTVVAAARPVVTATGDSGGTIQGNSSSGASGPSNGEISAPEAANGHSSDTTQSTSEGAPSVTLTTGGGGDHGDGSTAVPAATTTTTQPFTPTTSTTTTTTTGWGQEPGDH